jgi:AcrR family transcriptional regulator
LNYITTVALSSITRKRWSLLNANPDGEPSRTYHAPRRLAAARETRDRIRRAATELFLADGYSPTAVRSIARAAGVSEKTVYLQFATKLALLKEVVETALVGDTEAVAAADRQWFRDIVDTTDPERKLTLLADATAALHERTGVVFAMARGAAEADPDAADLWAAGKRGHRADMALVAASLRDADLLGPGRDVEWATGVLYVLIGPETWHLVRVELGHDARGYRDWLHTTLVQTFLKTAR